MPESLTLFEPPAKRPRGALARALRPWLKPKAAISIVIATVLLFCGLFAPLIAPFDPQEQDLSQAMQPPSIASHHPFGTDHVGRDILSRLIYGAPVSLIIAVTVVCLSGIFGVFLGVISGYFGGKIDFAIQKLGQQ